MRWTTPLTSGVQRYGLAAVVVEEKIYSFGGYFWNTTYSSNDFMDIHILDTTKSPLEWKLLQAKSSENTPLQRSLHTVVAYGHQIYLWGDNSHNDNTLYRFDTKTLKWELPQVNGGNPAVRHCHTSVVIKNKMYVYGGEEKWTGHFTSDIHVLDLETLSWTTIPASEKAPIYRESHTATVYQDRFIIIFGGREDGCEAVNTIACFDVVDEEWIYPEATGDLPKTRHSHASFMYNDCMYIFGGGAGGGEAEGDYDGTKLNDLFRYNPETKNWQQIHPDGQNPSPRTYCGCVRVHNKVFIFGGFSKIPPSRGSEKKYEINDDTAVLELNLN